MTRRNLGARSPAGEAIFSRYVYNGWEQNPGEPYSSQGRLKQILAGTPGSEITEGALLNLSYRYDVQGNITRILDANMAGQEQAFTYDLLDRITAAEAVGGGSGLYSESYTYDSEGRLASKGGVNYTYDAAHAHAVSALSNGNSYSYDANGSMTTRVIGTDTYSLLYDGALRLTEARKNGVSVATFHYDGDGQMVEAVVGGITTRYVGGYFEWHTSGVLSASTKYYSAGSARIAMRQMGVVTYLFGDHLGSTSVAWDDAADTTRRQGYTAFGTERYRLGGDMPTRYQFTGQRGFEELEQ